MPLPLGLTEALAAGRDDASDLLTRSLAIPSPSGQERKFTQFIARWAKDHNLQTDLFETDESALAAYPQSRSRHIPLTNRPTLVLSIPADSTGRGRSVLFNAHADTVSVPDPRRWSFPPFSGQESNGRIYGRGACDVKGPLVAALWAITAVGRYAGGRGWPGKVALELIPGEEDCVGLGTLTSYVRGYKDFDAVVILEPTENRPCSASRSGLRFVLTVTGLSVHGTVKWLGRDVIALLPKVLDALKQLEHRFQEPAADPLFAQVPFTRPVTVDQVHAGEWQGMVADRCTVAGYFELLPTDDLATWKTRFEQELRQILTAVDLPDSSLFVEFTEEYTGHRTRPDHPLCLAAAEAYGGSTPPAAFNSGCEAGLRAALAGTPTLVWGPGSLAQAHAVDEYIEWSAVEAAAKLFATFLLSWTHPRVPTT